MGEPFLWVHANPRQECLGRFTQLFDTGGGAWGRGQPVERSVCFVDEWKLWNAHLSPRFRMLEEAVTQALRRGNSRNRWIAAACSGRHFTPSCSAFLTPERCSGANAPESE